MCMPLRMMLMQLLEASFRRCFIQRFMPVDGGLLRIVAFMEHDNPLLLQRASSQRRGCCSNGRKSTFCLSIKIKIHCHKD